MVKTRHRRPSGTLSREETLFNSLAQAMPSGVIILDGDHLIRFINPAARAMLNIAPDENVLGQAFLSCLPPDLARAMSAQLTELLQQRPGHSQRNLLFRLLDQQGNEAILQGQGNRITFRRRRAILLTFRDATEPCDPDKAVMAGELAGVNDDIHDITNRKRYEGALREGEEKYRTLVERSNDGIIILQDGLIVFFNGKAARDFGYEGDEILGRPLTDFVHPDEAPKILDRYHRRLAGEDVPEIYETIGMHKDGRGLPREFNVSLMTYLGRPATLVMIRDITDRKRAEASLRESEEKFRILAESAATAIFIYQGNTFRYVNSYMEMLVGYSREELLRMNFWDVIHPEFRELTKERGIARQKGERVPSRYQFKILTKSGEERWVDFSAAYMIYEGWPAAIGTAYDITERRRAEEQIRESEQKYRQLVETLQEGIWVVDRDALTTFVNPRMAEMLGYTIGEVIGRSVYSFMDEVGADICRHNLQRRAQGIKESQDFQFLRKDGGRIFANVETTVIKDEQGGHLGYIAGVMDITDRKRAEEEIMRLAYHDALTGLPNRMLFNDRLNMAMAHARRYENSVGVMMLDLDGFKEINDSLGHNVGDLLLQSIALRLADLVRTNDTVARMGGDEFMIILPEINEVEDVGRIGDKLVNSFQEPFACNGYELRITASIGIAVFPADAQDVDTLVKYADIAMYRAKNAGRNGCRYYSSQGPGPS